MSPTLVGTGGSKDSCLTNDEFEVLSGFRCRCEGGAGRAGRASTGPCRPPFAPGACSRGPSLRPRLSLGASRRPEQGSAEAARRPLRPPGEREALLSLPLRSAADSLSSDSAQPLRGGERRARAEARVFSAADLQKASLSGENGAVAIAEQSCKQGEMLNGKASRLQNVEKVKIAQRNVTIL
uniref:Uncharacterized protein n=1 Tax=Sphaerodactylus townsendi TaxID=933632 RepID=A0ACB8FXB4_9SAUR